MSANYDAKLVRMANQIATFFESQPGDSQVDEVAGHLEAYWDPLMRHRLSQILAAGGAGLSPLARAAAQRLEGATA